VVNNSRVSLCMIVRDEEQNLEACLAPVADLVDEIVIVDTGSHDATKSIASRFTANVHDFPWCDDFAAARNECLRHATGDWIFWLDADDRIRPEQIPLLRQTFGGLDERPRVMMMDIVMPPSSPQEEIQIVSHARLFRRHPLVRWQGRIHEQLGPCFETLGYQRVFTDVQIEHLGYIDRVQAHRKLQSKLRLLRMDYAVNPDDPCTLLHLATALCGAGRLDEAQAHILRLLCVADHDPNYSRWGYETQVRILLTVGKIEQALQCAQRGTARFRGSLQLQYMRAMAEYILQDHNRAAQTLEELIASPPLHEVQFGSFANLQTKLAPRLLAIIRRLQKMYSEAESMLRFVLSHHPGELIVWYELGMLAVDRADPEGLKTVGRQLLKLPGGDPFAGLLVALWHLRHGDLATAGQFIDQLLATDPQAIRARLLRAEWLNKMNAPLDTQIAALRDIVRITPGDKEAQRFLEQALKIKQQAAVAPVLVPMVASPVVAVA
jgi:tetratricopeptide (TPR) repeat protein